MAIGANVNLYLGNYDSRDLDIPVVTFEQAVIANWMGQVLAQYELMFSQFRQNFIGRITTNHVEAIDRESTGRMQRGDQYSRPDLRRRAGKYKQYYPLFRFQDATGWTEDFLDRATLRDLANDAMSATQRDQAEMLYQGMKALLRKETYTFDDEIQGELTIRGLLNGDSSIVPPSYFGESFLGTHNHYLATNASPLTQAHIQTVKDHLTEHGYKNDLVLWIPENLRATVEGFANFYEIIDPLVAKPFTPQTIALGVRDPDAIGRLLDFEVVVKPVMPDNYLFAWSRAIGPPLVERQPDLEFRRGLRVVAQERSFPLRDSIWERRFGYAVANRINGVALQVVASATYTSPTDYADDES